MTEQERLAVLDMSKDKQDYWTVENTNREIRGGNYESLADLAFRLRDEAVKVNRDDYLMAICTVSEHQEGVCICDKCFAKSRKDKPLDWWADSKPIDWIIAALIAKESK